MICPTPGCGYRMEYLDYEITRMVYEGTAEEYVRAVCCDACRSVFLIEPTIDENGVGPDMLVPVLDAPPGDA